MKVYWQGFYEISFALLLVCFVLCSYYYLRLQKEKKHIKIILVFLRIISFVLLIMLVAKPHINWIEINEKLSEINFILDDSHSMKDYNPEINEVFSYINSIANTNNVLVNFYSHNGSKINEFGNYDKKNTDFSNIKNIINEDDNNVNILVTDGNINEGINFNTLKDELKKKINIIGIGHSEEGLDLGISELEYSKYHLEGETFELKFTLNSNLSENENVYIIIENSNGIIYKDEQKIDSGYKRKDFHVKLPSGKIKNINKLSLLSDIPEKNNFNNFKNIDIEILREDRVINFVSGSVSPNTSFIKNILKSIPRTKLIHSFCVESSWNNEWYTNILNSDVIVFENYPIKVDDIYLLEKALNQNIPIIVFESPSDGDFMNNFLRDKYQISSDKNLENLSYKFIQNEKYINAEMYPEQKLNYIRKSTSTVLEFEKGIAGIVEYKNNLLVLIPNLSELFLMISKLNEENNIHKQITNFINKNLNKTLKNIVITPKTENELIFGDLITLEVDIFQDTYDSIISTGLLIKENNYEYMEIFNFPDKKHKYSFVPNRAGEVKIISFYINENLDTIWSNPSNYIINDNHNENYKKSINEKELKDLAIASGGLYYDYNNFIKINKNLEFKEEINKTKRTITTIDYQVLWIFILFFLITEWFIRKKNGLL
ncbi:MAG: hypothetical protein VX770_03405 [Candidatus Neomarinimicrobiota bacterium]|nr:hypothetical protein [Candidatus Neomarinimicrobiota bacterium]